jgi:hypothetical protein
MGFLQVPGPVFSVGSRVRLCDGHRVVFSFPSSLGMDLPRKLIRFSRDDRIWQRQKYLEMRAGLGM